MDIVHLVTAGALGAEQAIDQYPQSIGLFDDDAGIFAQGRIRQLFCSSWAAPLGAEGFLISWASPRTSSLAASCWACCCCS